MSINTIITAVQGQLQQVSGVGQVSDRPGGVAFWASSPGEGRSYWEIDLALHGSITQPVIQDRAFALGGNNMRRYLVTVNGYLPMSYRNPNTFPKWRDLLDAVCAQIRTHKTLGLQGAINDTGEVQVTKSDYMLVSPGSLQDQRASAVAGEVQCHHAEIQFYVEERVSYTAQ